MRRNYIILLRLLLLMTLACQTESICQNDWLQNGLYCYYFSSNSATQAAAVEQCSEMGSSLVYIDDGLENEFLYLNGPSTTKQSYWIAFTRIFGSIWRWAGTGSAGTLIKWDLGEPDGEGSCARITHYSQGVWRDWDCKKSLPFICKKFADCGIPPPMDKANVSIPGYDTTDTALTVPKGSPAFYTCHSGYEFMDSNTKTSVCDLGGQWKPDVPRTEVCGPKACPPPPLGLNHVLTNATADTKDFGLTVSYKCEEGYWFNQFELGVTKHLTCMADRKWYGDTATDCTKVWCTRPVTSKAIANTSLNTFGTVANYKCNLGYRFADNTTVKDFTCSPNGWDPPPMECQEMRCPEFSVSGAWPSTKSRAVFAVVTWTCNPGTRFPDTTIRKTMACQMDETWTTPITDSCAKKRCLTAPPNNSDTYTFEWDASGGKVYLFGDYIVYTCIPEFFFSDGSPTRNITCNEDGLWSPSVVSECLGEKIVVTPATHKPTESKQATSMGTVALIVLALFLASIVLFDAFTFGKHLVLLKKNLYGEKTEQEKLNPKDEGKPLALTDV